VNYPIPEEPPLAYIPNLLMLKKNYMDNTLNVFYIVTSKSNRQNSYRFLVWFNFKTGTNFIAFDLTQLIIEV